MTDQPQQADKIRVADLSQQVPTPFRIVPDADALKGLAAQMGKITVPGPAGASAVRLKFDAKCLVLAYTDHDIVIMRKGIMT